VMIRGKWLLCFEPRMQCLMFFKNLSPCAKSPNINGIQMTETVCVHQLKTLQWLHISKLDGKMSAIKP
jgi:hypothetical protein